MNLALEFVFAIGAVICHQLPERSFFIDGRQLPVCARCTGLYLGGLVGLALWFMWKIGRHWRPITVAPRTAMRIVIGAGLPTVVTVATAVAGIWDGSNITRALVTMPLGISAGAVVAAVFTKDLR